MKSLSLLFLSLLSLARSYATEPIEQFCVQYAAGAEVRVYRGFPLPGFDRDWPERVKKAECIELSGEVFYPDAKTISEKEATIWLARATNPDNYYPSVKIDAPGNTGFHADIAFWCVTPDHKNQAYYLVSFATSQVQIATVEKGVSVALTLELEKLCREIHQRYFDQELKDEQKVPAPKPSP
jgi:hypothetical protein